MSDDDLLRLLTRTPEFHDSQVQLGSVPERPPIPIPAGARVLGSVLRGPSDEPDQVTAYLDVAGDAAAIRASFDASLKERGFAAKVRTGFTAFPGPGGGGGFAHSMRPGRPPGPDAVYCAGEEGPYYTVNIGEGDPTPVSVSWHAGLGMGWHPCGAPHRPMMAMEEIPSLSSPPGVMVQGGGGGGSPDAWYAQGIAFTDKPSSTLLDHFANELEADGAERLEREDARTTAWGRWKLAQKDLETIVGVVAAHPSMRLLLRYTYSQKEQTRQRRMMTSGWSSMHRLG